MKNFDVIAGAGLHPALFDSLFFPHFLLEYAYESER
jgi:hypothetical protein